MQRATAYAHALVSLAEAHQSPDALVTSLDHVLRKRGEISLYPRIVLEVKKEIERHNKRHAVTLTVARESDVAALSKELADKGFKADRVSVDERLVGGYTIGTASSYIDQSFRSALLKLFTSLV